LICVVEVFTLFLLPTGRPWRRLAGMEDKAWAVPTLVLFLLPRGCPRPRFSTATLLVQIDNASIGHGGYYGGSMEKCDETLSNLGKKTMQRQRLTVES
jgi:hypothetical protein